MFMSKLVRVSDSTHKKLAAIGRKDESYDSIVNRLITIADHTSDILPSRSMRLKQEKRLLEK